MLRFRVVLKRFRTMCGGFTKHTRFNRITLGTFPYTKALLEKKKQEETSIGWYKSGTLYKNALILYHILIRFIAGPFQFAYYPTKTGDQIGKAQRQRQKTQNNDNPKQKKIDVIQSIKQSITNGFGSLPFVLVFFREWCHPHGLQSGHGHTLHLGHFVPDQSDNFK